MILCRPAFEAFDKLLKLLPGNCLEIGVLEGESIATLARSHPHKTIYGVDPFIEDGYTVAISQATPGDAMPTQRAKTYANIEGLPNVTLFEERSAVFAEKSDGYLRSLNVALVLIDGSHWRDDVLIDTEIAMRLIGDKEGGIIFDDLDFPEVREAYDIWLGKHGNRLAPAFDLITSQPMHLVFHGVNLK